MKNLLPIEGTDGHQGVRGSLNHELETDREIGVFSGREDIVPLMPIGRPADEGLALDRPGPAGLGFDIPAGQVLAVK